MRIGIAFILMPIVLTLLEGCKKDAPYIGSLVGTYKVSGSMYAGAAFTRSLNDTLITITKVDDWTLQFISSSCDSTFRPVSLAYSSENGTTIQYSMSAYGHSPNSACIYFAKPPNVSFTYYDGFYCQGTGTCGSSLAGTKVP